MKGFDGGVYRPPIGGLRKLSKRKRERSRENCLQGCSRNDNKSPWEAGVLGEGGRGSRERRRGEGGVFILVVTASLLIQRIESRRCGGIQKRGSPN